MWDKNDKKRIGTKLKFMSKFRDKMTTLLKKIININDEILRVFE